MRKAVLEYIDYTENEIAEFATEAIVVVDTNVLLDLYRVSADQREQICGALELIGDRLWLPYQVALEFHSNRLDVVAAELAKYQKAAQGFTESLRKGNGIDDFRDPEIKESIQKALLSAEKKFLRDFAKLRAEHVIDWEVARSDDPVLNRLDSVYSNPKQIADKPDSGDTEKRKAEALRRFKAVPPVPPGYEDFGKKDDPTGDYLIWAEMIEHAKKAKRPLLFVTRDTKPDWFLRIAKQHTIGPRPELRAEFLKCAEQRYHQTTLKSFLWLANKHLNAKVSESTLDVVAEEVRSSPPFITIANFPSADVGLADSRWQDVLRAATHVNDDRWRNIMQAASGMNDPKLQEMFRAAAGFDSDHWKAIAEAASPFSDDQWQRVMRAASGFDNLPGRPTTTPLASDWDNSDEDDRGEAEDSSSSE
ncbi:PIN domain-containing protein [Rhodococcus sp. NPDC056960]|uniref:PIN domain-containing protein n=1 Tax=Rhodococcus sp. NPDC056960 TaxID=3345982 RepID=UPI003627EF50